MRCETLFDGPKHTHREHRSRFGNILITVYTRDGVRAVLVRPGRPGPVHLGERVFIILFKIERQNRRDGRAVRTGGPVAWSWCAGRRRTILIRKFTNYMVQWYAAAVDFGGSRVYSALRWAGVSDYMLFFFMCERAAPWLRSGCRCQLVWRARGRAPAEPRAVICMQITRARRAAHARLRSGLGISLSSHTHIPRQRAHTNTLIMYGRDGSGSKLLRRRGAGAGDWRRGFARARLSRNQVH